ncbi:Hsp20/alpha crystallin family protein [Geothermobacter hydrogeniphilus]|uniref:SHSP domain-containing protein n=1 Tax=Geothermobacter hydrogeniphilus TaxID=1969733 RepID=A0A1X0Y3Q5_9BACT|nr:Hsp20/alpha crystallin family protein [Geothermobacter hydrogeniphilus]ORJ59796.1 hypothetical protein B5V00_08965 [Geothermobacter hydrogeniphilus]
MPLVRWNPLPELEELRRRMDEMSREDRALVEEKLPEAIPWQPLTDIYEDETQIVLCLELPGVPQEDITLQVEDHQLVVAGERHLPQEEGFQRVEGNYGPFSRMFALPPGISEEEISARCENGVLRVVLPKQPAGKPKQIEVAAD